MEKSLQMAFSGMQNSFRLLLVSIVLGSLGVAVAQSAAPAPAASDKAAAAAAQDQGKPEKAQKPADPNQDPLKRQVPDSVRREQAKRFKKEVKETYKKWLDQDVRWIITDEERSTFMGLSNDEERDNFIEQFWLRRNPDPESVENTYKEEHYRRIAYANEHFAAGIPGWKTDRGRIYIMYGKPDSQDSHPSGGMYQRPEEEGGGTTSTYPFEVWRYRYLEDIGQEIEIEFVDSCMCGEYHMTMDRSEKDALLYVPGAGLTSYEEMGLASKTDRFTNSGLERLGTGPFTNMNSSKQFDRLETFAKLNQAPKVKFKDLEEKVTHRITVNLLPFDVRADFVRITGDTVLVPITIQVQNKDVTFVNKSGVQRATINIFGRATTMTGRIAQTFEDTVQIDTPAELLEKTAAQASVYWKALPLRTGRYRLDLVLKDVNGDRAGTYSKSIIVPEFSEDKLASSTLIVADLMEKVPTSTVGAGNFVIGDTKVRPRVAPADGKPAVFKRTQRANFWMQVYNLGINQQTRKSDATIEYDIVNLTTNKPVVHAVEKTVQMGNVGEQVTLEKSLPLASLEPGMYQVTIKVTDEVSKQSLTSTPPARFAVE
jgi:GWxTD domain-containing protein